MKRFLEVACLFALGSGIAHAGGIGGGSGNTIGSRVRIEYDSTTQVIRIYGRTAERFEIGPSGSSSASGLTTYPMDPADLTKLQDLADTRKALNAVVITRDGEVAQSYNVVSGEELENVKLIDRRSKISPRN